MSFLDDVRNIHAIGRNFVKHIEELGNEMPSEPVLFSKSPSCLVTGDRVVLPSSLMPIHHEVEVVLRIGQDVSVGTCVGTACVSHVALGIDFTARLKQDELKTKGLPWHVAKNFRDSCYVTEFTQHFDLDQPIDLKLLINGDCRQQGSSVQMIWSFTAMLAWINRTIPLEKGDLVYTGTPVGVGPVVAGDTMLMVSEALGLEGRCIVDVA